MNLITKPGKYYRRDGQLVELEPIEESSRGWKEGYRWVNVTKGLRAVCYYPSGLCVFMEFSKTDEDIVRPYEFKLRSVK